MINYITVKVIKENDWNHLVKETYQRPYCLQQQEDCRDRGYFQLTVPYEDKDEEMNDSIPDEVNGDEKGVKFAVWLARDPHEPNFVEGYEHRLFWHRNFYPDPQMVANDLLSKGLIEAGEYLIHIN